MSDVVVAGEPFVAHGSPGLSALHRARDAAAKEIAAALQRVIPKGFRGKITATVDNGVVQAHDVAVELRLPQPRHPMK